MDFVNGSLDFGYPWWLSYGHLVILGPALLVAAIAYWRKWPRWILAVAGLAALWAGTAFAALQIGFNVNARASLPTESFLSRGAGRVLDLGAGTGRSSIMVLEARPEATLVAVDLFAESFDRHFGAGERPQERLQANLRAAGVEDRATIVTGDMRELPFENATFDAAVSCYAMDHLGREGMAKALEETARILKPGGEFLMMVVGNDAWTTLAFGPMLAHNTHRADYWRARLEEVGFEVIETPRQPGTYCYLARRR